MLYGKMEGKFVGFKDGKAAIVQGINLELLDVYEEAGTKLREWQHEEFKLIIGYENGNMVIVDAKLEVQSHA